MTETFRATPQPNDPTQTFVGRRQEIAWTIDHLSRRQGVLVLYGPARVGKTALLRQLADRLAAEFVPVLLDASKASGWADASPLLQIAGEVGRSVRAQTELRPAPPDAAAFAEAPGAAWQAFCGDLALRLDGKEIVLLIDNADRADREWLSTLLDAGPLAVLAARDRARLGQILPDGVVAPPSLAIGPLDHDAADALVKALVTPHVQIDPWATRRVLELASHQAHYIRVLCHAMLECCINRSPLMPPDVEETVVQLLDAPPAEFPEAWEALSPTERYVLALLGSLRGQGGIATQYDIQKASVRVGRPLAASDIVRWVEGMVERGLLEKLGANSYRFTVELFRLWLQHSHPPDQVFRHRVGPVEWPDMAASLAGLKRGFVRRRTLWISLGIIALVAVVFALQPAVRGPGAAEPTPTPAATTAALPVDETPSRLWTPTPTLVPTPAAILPDYDLALMSRADANAPWQIHVLNTQTGKRLSLSKGDASERTPKWSPDGRSLLFVSEREGNREVYVAGFQDALEGSLENAVNLSNHKLPDWQPAWSPDGRRVAFSSYRDDNWELYLVNSDGSGLTRLTDEPESDFSPTWSPDGKRVLFVSRRRGDADLWLLDPETGAQTQLTRGERDEYDPTWSPDGEWIAYVTQFQGHSDIYVMRADGSEAVNLTNSAYANDFQPAWTTDSKRLVFVSYTMADGDHDLYIMNRDGSEVRSVTDDDQDNLAPCVHPDMSTP